MMFSSRFVGWLFCAVEPRDSSLSDPSTSILESSVVEFCCVDVSACAQHSSICELPLLAAAVADFMTRLFLGSESCGIGMSFKSCGAAKLSCFFSDFLQSSDVSFYFFWHCLVQHPSSSIQASDPSGGVGLCSAFQICSHCNTGILQWYRRPRWFFSCFSHFVFELPQTALVVVVAKGSICVAVHSPLAVNRSPRGSDHVVDGFFVPPVLLVLTSRPRALFLTPSHTPNLYLGFILFNGSEDIGLASTFPRQS